MAARTGFRGRREAPSADVPRTYPVCVATMVMTARAVAE